MFLSFPYVIDGKSPKKSPKKPNRLQNFLQKQLQSHQPKNRHQLKNGNELEKQETLMHDLDEKGLRRLYSEHQERTPRIIGQIRGVFDVEKKRFDKKQSSKKRVDDDVPTESYTSEKNKKHHHFKGDDNDDKPPRTMPASTTWFIPMRFPMKYT